MTARTSKRRDPRLAGVAGITADDLDALDQGRTTLLDIADRIGCSKQAVSKKIRAMRAAAPTDLTIPAISPVPASTGAPPTSTGPTIPPGAIPAGSVAVDPAEIATSACLGLLVRAHAALIGPDALGPSALKALSTTISTATAELRLLNVMAPDDDDAALSVLTVRTMSDEEHEAIKLRVGQPDDYEE